MLNVGDKVKVVGVNKGWSGYVTQLDKYVGVIGTVYTIYDDSIKVKFSSSEYWCFKSNMLEKVKEKKKSNLVEVDFVRKGDMVKIIAVRNLLSYKEIVAKYGEEVAKKYGSYLHTMFKYENAVRINTPLVEHVDYTYPLTITSSAFDTRIAAMKKAGTNLVAAIKEVRELKKEKIETITI